MDKFYGVPQACGPLLQLATAQAGKGNSPNLLQQNIGLKVLRRPVHICNSGNVWRAHVNVRLIRY